jgi:muramoyltetrapeptide carboxypeptidase LdcA involved in peptidoglycan recycling
MKDALFFDKTKHKIQIIAPSSPLATYEEGKEILQKALQLFTDKGINVQANPECVKVETLPWHANTVEFRANDIKKALLDEDVRIIWALRGGSSAAEVAELIDVTPVTPKVLIGFSDITVLHSLFNEKFKLPTIHGEVITRIIRQNKASFIDEVFDIVNENKNLSYKLKPLNDFAPGEISGKLKGGNLKVLTTLIGTDLQSNLNDAFLIIEDVAEKGYAIYRHLIHLRQAGMLKSLKAAIFGDFTGGDELDGKNYVNEAINHFAENANFPCFRISNLGHGPQNNPVILGAECTIENNTLIINNPF